MDSSPPKIISFQTCMTNFFPFENKKGYFEKCLLFFFVHLIIVSGVQCYVDPNVLQYFVCLRRKEVMQVWITKRVNFG